MAAAVNRLSQNLVLALLGGAVLRISAFSTTYLNYVKPGFRPFLIGAGAGLLILGLTGLVQAWRVGEEHGDGPVQGRAAEGGDTDGSGTDHAHGHGHANGHGHGHANGHGHGGPRVAWLLCLPVFAIFLIAPPALGSFAAARSDDTPRPRSQALSAFTPLTGDGPVDMKIGEFIGRAWDDEKKSLTGRRVRLTGFAVPSKKRGQWYLTRMQLACCAADAFPLKVAIKGVPAPPADTWVEVTGTWIPPTFEKMPNGVVHPELSATDLVKIDAPAEPYED
ncbi:TIGR03943 family protein [Planomonospora sp. ID82291]|uniref:TIGR03943 family putative permease subunit n=1 Tax=Planomonospora sp. ID82291 TaxID=2738136 RepID=UPI0018C3E04E|nr:TIGR03943 family protein [Planomonospora sp. ID82291]MBG0814217.1 TIGR03943 family protein [Planomonospora sp. ID82291]